MGQAERPAAGFTLIEILVALTIFAVGVASTLALTTWLVRGAAYGQRTTAATVYAQDKVEELMAGSYTNLAGGSDTIGAFSRLWTVTNGTGAKSINVRVSWSPVAGGTRDVTMRSMMARP